MVSTRPNCAHLEDGNKWQCLKSHIPYVQNPRMFMLWCLLQHSSYTWPQPLISGLLWMPMRCFLSLHMKGKWRNQDTLWFRKWASEISTNRRALWVELIHVTYLYVCVHHVGIGAAVEMVIYRLKPFNQQVGTRKIKVILMCVDM